MKISKHEYAFILYLVSSLYSSYSCFELFSSVWICRSCAFSFSVFANECGSFAAFGENACWPGKSTTWSLKDKSNRICFLSSLPGIRFEAPGRKNEKWMGRWTLKHKNLSLIRRHRYHTMWQGTRSCLWETEKTQEGTEACLRQHLRSRARGATCTMLEEKPRQVSLAGISTGS